MGTQDTQNSSAVEPIEQVQVSLSGKDDMFGEPRNQKKVTKKKKTKGGEVAEAYINEGLEKRELHVDHGEAGSGDGMNLAKKRKKCENKNRELNRTEMNNAKEVQQNEVEQRLDGESNSEQKNTQDNNKERKKKKKKSKRKHDEVDFERVGEKHIKESGQHKQNSEADDTGKVERKKRKKEKEDIKDDNRSRGTSGEVMKDEGDFPSVQQECVPDNVEGKIESNKHDGYAAKELERKKERTKKKKEHLKDYSSAAQQYNAETDSNGHMRTDEMQSNEVEHTTKKKRKKKKHTEVMEEGSED